jgi:NADPH:quinone reductase-like Zn-dependent oxidoreductase
MSIPQSTEAWVITKLSGGFSSLQKQTKDLPKSLAPNEVLVKIYATSLNYRDLIIPRGEYPFRKSPQYQYF